MARKPRRPPSTRRERARAVAEWAKAGWTRESALQIAEKYDVNTRTLYDWRRSIGDRNSEEVVALTRDSARRALNEIWTDHLADALYDAVRRIRQLINESDNLGDVVEAFRALSEVEITRGVLLVAANAPENRGYDEARPNPPGSSLDAPAAPPPGAPPLPH